MSRYNPTFRADLDQTRRDIYVLFDAWDQADLIMIAPKGKDIYEEAAVVFEFDGHPVRAACAMLGRYRDNLRAIYMTLRDIRMIYRRGQGDLLTGTVSQMLKLGAGAVRRDPYELMGIRPDAPLEIAEAAYRAMAKLLHPDTEQGDEERMKELNAAIEEVRTARKADG